MGLMLSILVVCVGVIEALSCYEHFQYGILHCATNIYEHARRRSSVFLNYTSRRLKLLSEDSIAEDEDETSPRLRLIDEPVDDFFENEPRKRFERENKSIRGKKLAKLEKQDKIDIVKKLLETPSKPPRAARSISMPERTSLIYTEKDLELTKIINELAIEPIDEINVEVDEVDNESVIEDFDKLFLDDEDNLNLKEEEHTEPEHTDNLRVKGSQNEVMIKKIQKDSDSCVKMIEDEVGDNEGFEEKDEIKTNTRTISQKISKFDKPLKISRSTSIDLDKVSLLLSKSTSKDLDKPKKQSTPKKLPEINSSNKSPSPGVELPSTINVIFESEHPPELIDKTFEELFSNMNETSLNEENVDLDEIENIIIEALDNETVENLGKEFISSEIAKYLENNKTEIKSQKTESETEVIVDVFDEKPLNEKYLQLLNKFADRIVCECLSEIRNLEVENLKLEISKANEQKLKNVEQNNEINPQAELRLENTIFHSSDSKSDKTENVIKEPITNLCNSSKIKLPEANDKAIILDNYEKEQLQEPLDERKMTDENKSENLTPIKLQLSQDEETTDSSVRSSPTGSVITILSVRSEDSTTSKPVAVPNEKPQAQDSVKTSDKILSLTNESVLALEYKPPASDICKHSEIIPLKWTDQVDKELSTNKDVIKTLEEAEEQEQKMSVKVSQNNTTLITSVDQVLEKLPESNSGKKVTEAKFLDEEKQNFPQLLENLDPENLKVLKFPEAKPEVKEKTENLTMLVPIENGLKNENSESILTLLPNTEVKQENKLNFNEEQIPIIPDNKNQTENDILLKNVEKDIIEQKVTSNKEEILQPKKTQKEGSSENNVLKKDDGNIESSQIKAPLKTEEVIEDKLQKHVTGNSEEEKICKKQSNQFFNEKPPEILAITNENLLAIDYKQKSKPTVIEDNEKEVIPMEWKKDFEVSQEKERENKISEMVDETEVAPVGASSNEDNSGNGVEKNSGSVDDNKIFSEKNTAVLNESETKAEVKQETKNLENQLVVKEKSSQVNKPMLAIKGEAVLALEYKRKEKPVSEDSKHEIIPMEWKVDEDAPATEKTCEMLMSPMKKVPENVEATTHISDPRPSEMVETQNKTTFPDSSSSGKPPREEVDVNQSVDHLKAEKEGNSSCSEKRVKEGKQTQSAPEAFWLIFSGEYTKAMSKDWHSGHFSCWQCDEALTGQRYVLRDDHPYCIKCYESVFANVCEECNKIIGIDSKDLSYKDKHWHEACFLCNKCRVSLVDKQFGSKADKIYCGNCYDAQFASRCDGCGEIFRAGTKKMEYKTRQWHEKCFCCCVCKTPIGTKSFIPREQEIYCATCYEEKFATRCVKCNKIITSGGVTYKNEPWHRECFTCTNCNTSLAGQRFTSRDEKPYCADCFGELFAKRCTSCSRPITGIGGTRFISFEDRHWHNDCFICASCKTSLVGRGFITDGDDIICPECAKQKLM